MVVRMEKINFTNSNFNCKLITEKNNLVLEKGQTLQARVIGNTPLGILLEIENTVLEAKTEHYFPINTELLLTVMGQRDQQTVLSLNKHINYYNLDISTLIESLGFEDTGEIRLIINKLIESKQQITNENINKLKILLNKLPLEPDDALQLLRDSSLYLAIFAFLNKEAGFYLLFNEKDDKHNNKGYLEINILYQSQNLGLILTNVIWQDKIMISVKCSQEITYQKFLKHLKILRQKINTLVNTQVEIVVFQDKNLAQKNIFEKEEHNLPLLRIDIRI